jgi:hypothetical protein
MKNIHAGDTIYAIVDDPLRFNGSQLKTGTVQCINPEAGSGRIYVAFQDGSFQYFPSRRFNEDFTTDYDRAVEILTVDCGMPAPEQEGTDAER